jgi:hypothetical protein
VHSTTTEEAAEKTTADATSSPETELKHKENETGATNKTNKKETHDTENTKQSVSTQHYFPVISVWSSFFDQNFRFLVKKPLQKSFFTLQKHERVVEAFEVKRNNATFMVLLILCSAVIPACSFSLIPKVMAEEQVFFEDNFETYSVGTFPASGGWELWYSGAGTEEQVIVDGVSGSPTKSLKLVGLDMWAGLAAKPLTSSAQLIGFEVNVRVEETNGNPRDNARVAFAKKVSSYISRDYAPVTFNDDGTICSGGQVLQPYDADRWYKVKLIMDRNTDTYAVWVDGELKAEKLNVTTTSGDITFYPSSEITALSVSQCYNGVTVYFDDVKIFSCYEANPKIQLVPDTGVAATTLVGSGYAPDSRISVTWDGTAIPTVPSPLTSDSHGNFTAIISALNQQNGTYTIKAGDQHENEATQTFTVAFDVQLQPETEQTNQTRSTSDEPKDQPNQQVIPEATPWIILPLLSVVPATVLFTKRKEVVFEFTKIAEKLHQTLNTKTNTH